MTNAGGGPDFREEAQQFAPLLLGHIHRPQIDLLRLVVFRHDAYGSNECSSDASTREIGLRRALGAKRRDIWLQFMLESTVLAAGGLAGVAVGLGAAAGAAMLGP